MLATGELQYAAVIDFLAVGVDDVEADVIDQNLVAGAASLLDFDPQFLPVQSGRDRICLEYHRGPVAIDGCLKHLRRQHRAIFSDEPRYATRPVQV